MPARLVSLDEGPDIPLDRAMVVVGRHPQCDARLDSLRVSRHHCCMTQDHGELVVRDLGSTNGIRINGQRVEFGRLRMGDELSIAHIRYRLDDGQGREATLADRSADRGRFHRSDAPLGDDGLNPASSSAGAPAVRAPSENVLAAAVRDMLPAGLADRYRIEVIVKLDENENENVNENPSDPVLGDVAINSAAAPE